MRKRSLSRYILIYIGQLILTIIVINIFGYLFATFASDMLTPAIAFPFLLVLLPPLMTGMAFRRIEGGRPGGGESLGFALTSTVVGLAVLAALIWLVRRYAPMPLPDLPPELQDFGGVQLLAMIAAGTMLVGNFLFFILGARKATK